MYENTSAAVWNGVCLSEYFRTDSGVKQGCILSPLLFALFLNDLEEVIGGGVDIGGLNVRILAYADDVVMIADRPDVLQTMIDNLHGYCRNWNLSVNLDKSEIMIAEYGGGRRRSNECWLYNGENVRVVEKYKYLGGILTPNLRWITHLEERVRMAKTNLNMVWTDFVGKDVGYWHKIGVFGAVPRSIVRYVCQV